MEAIILLGLLWAGAHMWGQARESRQQGRQNRLEQIRLRKPGMAITPGQKRRAVTSHDIGWWAGETLRLFPAHRRGWHSGWLAHRTASDQQRAVRERQRTDHLEMRRSFLEQLPELRERQARAQDAIDRHIETSGMPKGKAERKAVREAVGATVLPFPARPAAGPAPAAEPVPGPYVTRRADGKREATGVRERTGMSPDGNLFIVRDSDWFGLPEPEGEWSGDLDDVMRRARESHEKSGQPVSVLGRRGPEGSAEVLGKFRNGSYEPAGSARPGDGNGRPAARIDPAAAPAAAAPATNGGTPVTTGTTSETTYGQTLTEFDGLTSEAEAEIARLRMRQVGQKVEMIAAAGVGGATLSHLADVNDGVQAQIQAAQQQLDSAPAGKAALVRDHGQGADYHQSAHGGGAEKSFLRE